MANIGFSEENIKNIGYRNEIMKNIGILQKIKIIQIKNIKLHIVGDIKATKNG